MRSVLLTPSSLFLLALGLFLSGCTPLYVTTPANMPLFSQDGEVQTSAAVSSNGYNAQVAWAPVEHLAVIANGSLYVIADSSNLDTRFRRTYGEVGTGYWTRLNKYLRLETLFGVGWGITGEFPQRDLYRKYFFQPNFGISDSYYDFGFSPRIALVRHVERRSGTTELPDPVMTTFLEPVFHARLGYEQFKFQVQLIPVIPLGTSEFDFRRWNASFGISLTFGKDFERYGYTPN